MAKILALIILAFVFVPVTAFAQEYNQSMTGLITEGIIESDKATGYSTKLEHIQVSCRDAAFDRDRSIIPACVEITKKYNEAMSKLFANQRNIGEDILY